MKMSHAAVVLGDDGAALHPYLAGLLLAAVNYALDRRRTSAWQVSSPPATTRPGEQA